MPFGLCNAPATFMRLMYDICHPQPGRVRPALQRLGCARVVQTSLLEDGSDALKYSLRSKAATKGSSSSEEWARRAHNLLSNRLWNMACKAFNQAGDLVSLDCV